MFGAADAEWTEWTEWTNKLIAAKERQKADAKDVAQMRPWPWETERLRLRRKVAGSMYFIIRNLHPGTRGQMPHAEDTCI